MKLKQTRLIGAVAALSLIATACGGNGEEPASATQEAEPVADEEGTEGPEGTDASASYPDQAVEIVVPFDPGGGADNAQRVFNTYAEPLLDVPLSILNRPGAGGAVGWAEVMSGDADGYTLTIGAVPFNTLPVLMNPEETGYELEDWNYICIWGIVPDVIYVKEGGDYETLDDLVEAARENPRGILAGTTGATGTDALATYMLEAAAGVEFEQVAFSGDAESLQAVLAGTIDVMFTGSSHIQAFEGELRPLGIASAERSEHFPDVPTLSEQGYEIESARYRSLAAHVDVPADAVAFWEEICQAVSEDPEFQQAMLDQSQPPAYRNSADANAEISRLTDRYRDIIEEHGLRDEA